MELPFSIGTRVRVQSPDLAPEWAGYTGLGVIADIPEVKGELVFNVVYDEPHTFDDISIDHVFVDQTWLHHLEYVIEELEP